MRNVHSLQFDALEPRKLLTKAHVVAAHAVPAAVAAPLVLDGTLTVNNHAATTNMNDDGSSTTSTPVSGQLGALGEVRGTWDESVDEFGDYMGPDTLRLRGPKGTIFIAFSNQDPGKPHPSAHGAVYHEETQRLYEGTGAYARPSESGTIDLTSNAARTAIASLTLQTWNP